MNTEGEAWAVWNFSGERMTPLFLRAYTDENTALRYVNEENKKGNSLYVDPLFFGTDFTDCINA